MSMGDAARPTPARGPRILLVEDEPSLVLTLVDRLRSEGYDVASAQDGESGYELALGGSFDLVLLDVALPVPTIAEKNGSLTNCDGIVQKFSPALEDRGNSCPEWRFLVDLGKEIGSDFSYFSQFTSADAVLKEMGKEIAFFEMNND